jgi:nucleoid DNA-binding protein
MYKLPEDIEKQLQQKYNTVHIPSLVHTLFQEILQKTLKDGACHIREFGKFVSFQTQSSKTKNPTIRFKFRLALSLDKKLKGDQYLLQIVPVKAKVPFTEQHEQKVLDKKEIKAYNFEALQEANKHANKVTKDRLNELEIKRILEEDGGEEYVK